MRNTPTPADFFPEGTNIYSVRGIQINVTFSPKRPIPIHKNKPHLPKSESAPISDGILPVSSLLDILTDTKFWSSPILDGILP